MRWEVRIPTSVTRELDRLPASVRTEAIEALSELEEDAMPDGCVLLRGYKQRYRIKFYRDRYRIVYDVSERQRRVIVLRVRSRSQVYRGL